MPKHLVWDLRATAPGLRQGQGVQLGAILQTKEDLEFAEKDIRKGLASGIYQEMSHGRARRALSVGAVVSSAFVIWQGMNG